jgi:hypothetical protein
MFRSAGILIALAAGPCLAQTAIGLRAAYAGSKVNQEVLSQQRAQRRALRSTGDREVVVFIGDTVIPQFVDGGLWQTAITVINLENHATSFDILFFNDNGTDLQVPVVGQGVVRGMHISLTTAGSLTFETTGTSANLSSGWALLSQSTDDSVGIFAIFRQIVPGGQSQEAVVPAVNQFEDHFVLPFDNTKYVTGVALANPTFNTVDVRANIRNEQGQIIDTRQLSFEPYSRMAFSLPEAWSSTAGRRGAIEFLTTGFGVGALGLRFNGSAFTSLSVLQNIDWVLE